VSEIERLLWIIEQEVSERRRLSARVDELEKTFATLVEAINDAAEGER
jgi:hypothetical protein